MAISDQLVKLMGGQIVVNSQPQVGSDFSVFLSLPVADEAAVEKETGKTTTDDDNTDTPDRGCRLLLAEDNDINAMIAVEILGKKGAEVDVAENGQVAVDRFASLPEGYYDAILMDIQMPVMDGRAAAKAIRAMSRSDAKRIPIFALSADAFVEDERLSRESGMNGHLAKPINFDELWKTLQKALSEKEER
jgi:CheY-like chemotaxis protein